VLGAITNAPGMRDRSVVKSSVGPSARYSCSRSRVVFANGNTTMDSRGGVGCIIGSAVDAANGNWMTSSNGGPPAARSAKQKRPQHSYVGLEAFILPARPPRNAVSSANSDDRKAQSEGCIRQHWPAWVGWLAAGWQIGWHLPP
jgi:hypothetical protein